MEMSYSWECWSQGIEGFERTLLNTAYKLSDKVLTNVTINNLNFVNFSSIFVTTFEIGFVYALKK
jgi:hypothetical protein